MAAVLSWRRKGIKHMQQSSKGILYIEIDIINKEEDGQQVYNCRSIVIIQIQPVMKHQNIGKPLQQIRHVKKRSSMKFAFSNSSKVLSKQHANLQFMCLIQEKKNYQSLIKDQINKLQSKDTNVSDPEVEPFCSNNEGENPDQKINQYYKLELKNGTSLLLNAKIQKSIKSVRQNKQIDRYLDQKINTSCLNILEKSRKKRSIKSFFQSLKLSHRMLNKQKAARFFEYQKLTRKSFSAMFRFANEIFCIDEGVKQKQLIVKTLIMRRSLKKFIEGIKIQRLIKQSKNYAKKKQQRTKKLNYNYFKQQIKGEKCLIQNINILQKQRKKKILLQFVELCKCKTKIDQKRETLMRKKQKDCFVNLVMNLKQNKQERSDKFHNFLVEYEQMYQKNQKQYNQYEVQDYVKNKHMSSKCKEKMKTQIKLRVLTRKFNSNEKFRRGKQFLKLLESHKNIQLVKNLQSLNHKLANYKKTFIFQLMNVTKHQKKISQIFTKYVQRYLRNFRENISNDIKYMKSLVSVTGTKKWLIRNKHIFKSQPFKNPEGSSSKFRTDLGSESSVEFWNPISERSQIDLMQESKFKKLKEMRQKKQFIKVLKQRMATKKKQQALQYGYKQVRDRRTIKKVWENWKDKQKMRQVMREIDEEAAHQQNEEQNNLCEQVNKKIIINNKLRLLKQLSQGYKHFLNKKKLQLSRCEKLKIIFLSKLRSIRTIRQTNDQKMLELGKLSKKRYEFEWKKLIRLLRQNLFLKEIQKQKYIMINGKQLSLEGENHYESKNCEIQSEKKPQKKLEVQSYLEKAIDLIRKVDKNKFMRLLQANYKIGKGSIRVTSIYVSHIFSKMIANKQRQKQIKQIKTKEKQLERLMRIKLLKQSLNQIKMNHKTSVTIKKTASFNLERKRDKLIEVLKVLFMYSSESKLRKQKMGKMNEIMTNHQTFEKRELFVKLKRILSKRKQKQLNQEQLNKDIKIPDDKDINQNGFQKYLNKQMNQGDQLQQNQSYSQQSSNQFQRSHLNFEKSPAKEQFIQENSEEQIPYQKYRQSFEIKKVPTQNQSKCQFQMAISNQYEEPLEQKQNKFNESQISNQESYLANQYDYKYFENRNNLNVLKRYFKEWKLMAKQKQSSESHYQLAKKAFNGLKMYTKQKSLVKKYLMQYEQQLHYYPHSAEEYQQFRTVVQNS